MTMIILIIIIVYYDNNNSGNDVDNCNSNIYISGGGCSCNGLL